jgi:aldehyde dehydrogenase (NAD+)
MATPTTESITGTHWIGGRQAAGGGETIDVINPADGSVVGTVPAGTPADVDRAVTAARSAFRGWSETPVEERIAVAGRISQGLMARAGDVATTITAEMGAPISFSRTVQSGLPIGSSATFAAVAADFPWSEEIGNSLVVKEPIGVVGAITRGTTRCTRSWRRSFRR